MLPKHLWIQLLFSTFVYRISSYSLNSFRTFMYCDLWPYVLWPLDFQIQKRIVSAETIWENTVYISWCVNRVTVFQNFGLLSKQYVSPAPLRHISLGKGSIEGDWRSTMYWNRSYVDVYTINKKCNISGCIRRGGGCWMAPKFQRCVFLTINHWLIRSLANLAQTLLTN